MVASEEVSDERSLILAKDIAKKIETEMTYPGQIKVNVIRETRATEYALNCCFWEMLSGSRGARLFLMSCTAWLTAILSILS